MADRPWRTSLGLVAVLLWSAVIGFPVLLFHLNNVGLGFGEHLHAALMFVASQALVYWLVARPTKNSSRTAASPAPISATPFATAPPENQVWCAELVTTNKNAASVAPATMDSASIGSAKSPDRCTAKLIVTNYLGSSRSRIVYVEPGGTNHTLLPGEEMEVTATALGMAPSFRIVESDVATKVYVDGARIAVAATQHSEHFPGAIQEEAASDVDDQP